MRLIEDHERWRRLVARAELFETLQRTRVLEAHLQSIVESESAYKSAIEEHVERTNKMALVIERAAEVAALEKANAIKVMNSVAATLSDDLSRFQSNLDAIGVRNAIDPPLRGLLKDFGEGQATARLSLIASASSQFASLVNQQSFITVGAAVTAAGRALSDDNIIRHDHGKVIDSFFGDWSHLSQLPEDYGQDKDVRRETLQEVDADEALLDVSTEEAAALFRNPVFHPWHAYRFAR